MHSSHCGLFKKDMQLLKVMHTLISPELGCNVALLCVYIGRVFGKEVVIRGIVPGFGKYTFVPVVR